MGTQFPPLTMKAWQYSSTKGGLEKNLTLNPAAPLRTATPQENVVQVIAVALNPVDYKPAEVPLISRLLIRKPATPGIDFAGRIVTPAAAGSSYRRGQLVFGAAGTSPLAAGGLAEYVLTSKVTTMAVPEGVDPIHAATIPVAGLSAYQSIVPHVSKGDKVFINGGSGGTGVFGIQIAKAIGCHVTTTCSTPNVSLCRQLGADQVIDYKTQNVLEALKSSPHKFHHVVDNVGGPDGTLYWRCHEYTTPTARYVMVAGAPSLAHLTESLKRKYLPSLLGGGKRQLMGYFLKPDHRTPGELEQIVTWMKEGKVKAVVDQRFPMEQVPEAFKKLKTGRARGKIVIDVASETSTKDSSG